MPTPAKLTRQKREAILEGAGLMFAAHGFAGASMSAITRAAGTSKSTIYHHFRDKAGLFGAFVERECERNILSFFETVPDDEDIARALSEVGRRYLNLMTSPIVLAIDRIVTAEASSFPELAQVLYSAGPERAATFLSRWLEKQVKQGKLNIVDTEVAAEQFYMLCQARIVLRRKLHIADMDPRGKPANVIMAAVGMFMLAYAPNTLRGRAL